MSETKTKMLISRAALEVLRDVVGSRYAAAIDDDTTTIRTADRLEAQAIKADETIQAVINMADEHDLLDDEGFNVVNALAIRETLINELETDKLSLQAQLSAFELSNQVYQNQLAEAKAEIDLLRKANGEWKQGFAVLMTAANAAKSILREMLQNHYETGWRSKTTDLHNRLSHATGSAHWVRPQDDEAQS